MLSTSEYLMLQKGKRMRKAQVRKSPLAQRYTEKYMIWMKLLLPQSAQEVDQFMQQVK